MLSTKLNVALSSASITVNKASSTILLGKWNLTKLKSNRFYTQINEKCCCNYHPKCNKRFVNYSNTDNFILVSKLPVNNNIPLSSILSRSLSSGKNLEEKADVFGDLGDKQYEKIVLDDDEIKEEEFLKNEAKPNRRSVPSPGKYAQMIKKHITSGDLKAALAVLDRVKEDRQQPTNYMFNLLIRALAQRGELKKCFNLYNKMKKADLKPTLATYTSLFNACAESDNTKTALEKLNDLRQSLIENEIKLDVAHYNAMIKAYGRHGKLFYAFQLVDEMIDRKLTVGISTFSFLLQGTVSDKDSGFKYSLIVWQLLKHRKLKPNLYTYNLLLRTARDCKLGEFKIEDLSVWKDPQETRTLFVSSDRINLLAHPPQVCLDMPLIGDSNDNSKLLNSSNDGLESETDSTETLGETDVDKSCSEVTTTVGNNNNAVPVVNIESSSPQTNLLLMGGFQNFINQMKIDNVTPDIRTITYLMEIVPPTTAAEKCVIDYAKSVGVQLDIDFYNLLIRKRSFRFDYDNALKVMSMIQHDNLEPNIMTWGVLALTCRRPSQARELIEGMELSGHRINLPIIGAMISQASTRWLFGLVLEMMEKMRIEELEPTDKIYEILESFKKKAVELSKEKNPPDFVNKPFWQNGFRKFSLRYPQWVKEMKEESEKRREERYRKKKSSRIN